MSPTLNARGLGLGGTPLACHGRHRVSAVAVIGHSRRRNVEECTSNALQRLVLHRPVPPTGVAKRRDRQRTCAGRARNCGYVESRQGRREGTRCRSDLIPPTKQNKTKGGTLGSQPSSGGHSKMSPNLNARGLGLGGTPLACRGRHRVSAVAVIGHSRRRNVEVCTSNALQRLVLHRPVSLK